MQRAGVVAAEAVAAVEEAKAGQAAAEAQRMEAQATLEVVRQRRRNQKASESEVRSAFHPATVCSRGCNRMKGGCNRM